LLVWRFAGIDLSLIGHGFVPARTCNRSDKMINCKCTRKIDKSMPKRLGIQISRICLSSKVAVSCAAIESENHQARSELIGLQRKAIY